MSCPNCKDFHHLCKAACCGVVPIPEETWKNYGYKAQRNFSKLIPFADGQMIPVTKDNICPFLSKDLKCAIYDQRPEVCQLYGNATELLLTCALQNPDGSARSFFQRQRILKKQNQRVNELKNKRKNL